MSKWIELNIGIDKDRPDDLVLINVIKPIVDQFRDAVFSWHFLWEGKPWPEVEGKGITLMIRFLGGDKLIHNLRQYLDKKFAELENEHPEYYLGHCFGSHGDCGEEYYGEEENWGTEIWNFGIHMLDFGSEMALKLIENKDRLGRSEEYKQGMDFYADRYTHLFLNQISSLLDEPDFYLTEGVFRFALRIGKKFSSNRTKSIVEQTKRRIQSDC